jgi:hypothetical protein
MSRQSQVGPQHTRTLEDNSFVPCEHIPLAAESLMKMTVDTK